MVADSMDKKKQVTTSTQSKLGLSGGDNSSNSSFNTAATKNIKKT